jgi:hypothetical protein
MSTGKDSVAHREGSRKLNEVRGGRKPARQELPGEGRRGQEDVCDDDEEELLGQQLVVRERMQLAAVVEDAIEEGACVWCAGRKSNEAGKTRCIAWGQGS